MSIFFIADLHISEKNKEAFSKLEIFFNKNKISRLYILGDLFDFYLDESFLDKYCKKTLLLLKKQARNGIKIYFISGNRDFLIRKKTLQKYQIKFLSENFLIDLKGKKILLLHGDTLCTFDKNYQLFRKITHFFLIKNLIIFSPKFLKKFLLNKTKKVSKKQKVDKSDKIMDVNPKEVDELFAKTKADYMIHGHIHKANIFTTKNLKQRFVISSWQDKEINYVKLENNKIQLCKL